VNPTRNWLPLKIVLLAVIIVGLIGYAKHGYRARGGSHSSRTVHPSQIPTPDGSYVAGKITLTRAWSYPIRLDAMGGENIRWALEQSVQGEILVNNRHIYKFGDKITNQMVTVEFRVSDRDQCDLYYYITRGKFPSDWFNIALLAR
jgi:hypothetical protein